MNRRQAILAGLCALIPLKVPAPTRFRGRTLQREFDALIKAMETLFDTEKQVKRMLEIVRRECNG